MSSGSGFPMLLRALSKPAIVILGSACALSVVSATAIRYIDTTKQKNGNPCEVCKGKGFYLCKLCNGNSTIKWSPLYDPVFINPCLCPTCDGNKVQKCLNCLGIGYT